MKSNLLVLPVLIALVAWSTPSAADWTDARCEIYLKGEDQLEKMVPCTFSQNQGFITITRDDGVTHELSPEGDTPGNFRDQDGQRVFRQSGLGTVGQIFRFPDISIFVYWDTAGSPPSDDDNYAAPFVTRGAGGDYDATTRLPCKATGDSEYGSCPAGILRMDGGEASIVIENQLGQQFTINFMIDYVNATVGEVDARLEGDTWIVTRDNGEVYEVPLAAIEGG